MICTAPDRTAGIGTYSGCAAEQDGRAFIDEQDEAEGRQHLLNVIARIKPPDHHIFDDQAGERRGGEAGERGEHKRPGALAASAAP